MFANSKTTGSHGAGWATRIRTLLRRAIPALALTVTALGAAEAATVTMQQDAEKRWTIRVQLDPNETMSDFHIFVPEQHYNSSVALQTRDGWSNNKERANPRHDNNGDGTVNAGDRGMWYHAWTTGDRGVVRGGRSKTFELQGPKPLQDLGAGAHWYITNDPVQKSKTPGAGASVVDDGGFTAFPGLAARQSDARDTALVTDDATPADADAREEAAPTMAAPGRRRK